MNTNRLAFTTYCVSRTSAFVVVLLLAPCALTETKQDQYKQSQYEICATNTDNVVTPLVGPLKVMSLNIAHGRNDAVNQMLASEKSIRRNLHGIARLMMRVEAGVIGLQEADGPSLWSGDFDHVAELAQQADYAWYCRAGQAHSWLFEYGTAILAKNSLTDVISHSFSPTPPTFTKGFILGQIHWLPENKSESNIAVDIVSVHLDFSRVQVRQQQMAELLSVLSARRRPVIVLGDLNSDWFEKDSIVKQLVQLGNLQAYRPDANDLGTYRKNNRRLDWILISKELAFKQYKVLPDVVSDHYAIMAEIVVKPDTRMND